jgi:hypothetical protein
VGHQPQDKKTTAAEKENLITALALAAAVESSYLLPRLPLL